MKRLSVPSISDILFSDSFSITFCSHWILATEADFSASVKRTYNSLSAEFLKWYLPADDQDPELQCLLKVKQDLS